MTSAGGGSSRLLRRLNEATTLRWLFDKGPLTRPELVELTGFSKPTASEVIKRLRAAGLVTVIGRTSGGPGPRAERYAVNPHARFCAAVSATEAGGLDVLIGDLDGTVRARHRHDVSFGDSDVVDVIADAVRGACAGVDVPDARPHHLWLGVPGSYHERDDRVHNTDVPGLDRPGIRAALAGRAGCSVHIDNDVNLATLAERHHGAGGSDGFALLWLGERGIGLGVDLGSGLLRGHRGAAGEIGYQPIGVPGGPQPILTDLVGGPAIMELSRIHGRATAGAAEAVRCGVGDPRFTAAVADRIVAGLAAVVAVLDPAVVVLAGEIGVAGGDRLAEAVATRMADTAYPATITTSGVAGDPVLRGGLDAAVAALRDELTAAPV